MNTRCDAESPFPLQRELAEAHQELRAVRELYMRESAELREQLAAANRAISDSVSKWIPIGDRIPEPERAVLGYWPKNEYYKGGCETVRYCPSDAPDSCDAWIDGHGEAIDAPTHWMPNPETPK